MQITETVYITRANFHEFFGGAPRGAAGRQVAYGLLAHEVSSASVAPHTRRVAEQACADACTRLGLAPLAVRWFSAAYGRQVDARAMFAPDLPSAIFLSDDTPAFLAGSAAEHEARHCWQYRTLAEGDERLRDTPAGNAWRENDCRAFVDRCERGRLASVYGY